MMIDIPRLFASEFDATDDDSAWRFGVTLWLKSFHQVPAASLPDDDAALAKLCGLGRDVKTWRKRRPAAMRGWIRCDDGLLYHPVVAEVALEAWLVKLTKRLSSGAGNAARWGTEFDPEPIKGDIGRAARMLAAINPKSEALSKQQVALAMKRVERETQPEVPSEVPTGSPDVPSGSQGKGSEGKVEIEADASLSPRASPKAKTPIEGGFPGQPEITEAAEMIAAAGVVLDAADHAKRFRGHALTNDRRVADWGAAWRSWVEIEIGKAPAAAAPPAPAEPYVWPGPADIWGLAVARMGPDWAAGYVGRCAWRDGALICPSPTLAKGIRTEIGRDLDGLGYRLLEGQAA